MMPFDTVYPDVAARESRAWHVFDEPGLPRSTYVLREFYCEEPNCDCRRVIVHVHSVEQKRIVASVNYSFEPAKPPFDDEPQFFLDPLNPQSELSEVLIDMFEAMVAGDLAYRARLVRHYTMWKAVVDDPKHPDHAKVRTAEHDDPTFRPAFPKQPPARREAPKVGPNERCPCGSGKKYKKCCALKGAPAGQAQASIDQTLVKRSSESPLAGKAGRAGETAHKAPVTAPPVLRTVPSAGSGLTTIAPTSRLPASAQVPAPPKAHSPGARPLASAPQQGRRERPVETGEERHQFLLNPYRDERLTSCPLCKAPTKVRKFALAVHVEPGALVAQGLPCRYCPDDDLLIVHQDVLEAEMGAALTERLPDFAGKPYVVLGTFDRDQWRKGLRTGTPLQDPLGALHPFRKQLTLQVEPARWVKVST
jgi:hypothetical protein